MRLVVDGWVPNPDFLTQLLPNLLLKLSTVPRESKGAEVQQRLTLSASLPTSAKVPYYEFQLQSRVTGG